MKLLIELPDGYVGVVMRNQRIDGSAMDKLLRQAVIDGTPLDDVCEWKYTSTIDGKFVRNPHTNRLLHNNEQAYCNICGKKIKVVVE